MSHYNEIWEKAKEIIHSNASINDKMKQLCKLLDQSLNHYDWIGFYLADNENKKLHLGPYQGVPTVHSIISFGTGICGQSALLKKTFLIDNVHTESNYIACSMNVKSEIVVPIIKSNILIGQIDVDSHQTKAFGKEDEFLLERITNELSFYFS